MFIMHPSAAVSLEDVEHQFKNAYSGDSQTISRGAVCKRQLTIYHQLTTSKLLDLTTSN